MVWRKSMSNITYAKPVKQSAVTHSPSVTLTRATSLPEGGFYLRLCHLFQTYETVFDCSLSRASPANTFAFRLIRHFVPPPSPREA